MALRNRRIVVALIVVLVALGSCASLAFSPGGKRRLFEAFTPGRSSRSLDDCDVRFRKRLERVFARLRERGYAPAVISSWRSDERQDAIFTYGRARARLGGMAPTHARGGRSCHNRTDEGKPASLAVDVRDKNARTTREAAEFYAALGEEAKAEGLVWGGDWKRHKSRWSRYGLGWDPAHVESPRCRSKKQ